jgi:hypothetical protein
MAGCKAIAMLTSGIDDARGDCGGTGGEATGNVGHHYWRWREESRKTLYANDLTTFAIMQPLIRSCSGK